MCGCCGGLDWVVREEAERQQEEANKRRRIPEEPAAPEARGETGQDSTEGG